MQQVVPTTQQPITKEQEAYRAASELFHKNLDWVGFFREVLGVEGVIRRLFPTPEQLTAFEQTEQYNAIHQMLAKLRERNSVQPENKEPTRVITVRMPLSLHATLRTEAHEKKTSMNKLCISKLLQMVDDDLVPSD